MTESKADEVVSDFFLRSTDGWSHRVVKNFRGYDKFGLLFSSQVNFEDLVDRPTFWLNRPKP